MRRGIWGGSKVVLRKKDERERMEKGDDEHTQTPTSGEGVNEFIDERYDEYPDKPTSNVSSSSQCPVLA